MFFDNKVYAANAQGKKLYLLPAMANRHGLITGATGTGKTVTMKVLAESFSDMGVPVFLADVKGDVSGLAEPGADSEGMQKRIDRFDLREYWSYRGYPVAFWDIFGEKGIPVRIKVSDMGPLMFSRLLGLTEAQTGILHIVYRTGKFCKFLERSLYKLRFFNILPVEIFQCRLACSLGKSPIFGIRNSTADYRQKH